MSEPDQINSAIKNRIQIVNTEIGNDEVGLIVREVSGELKINIQSRVEAQELFRNFEGINPKSLAKPCTFFEYDMGRIFLLGPSEWLISTRNDIDKVEALFDKKYVGYFSCVDVTDGYTELKISGNLLDHILKQSLTYDYFALNLMEETESFRCVQTNFARVPALFWKSSKLSVNLLVRRSYADYLIEWLSILNSEEKLVVL